jgi:hypothetical protein
MGFKEPAARFVKWESIRHHMVRYLNAMFVKLDPIRMSLDKAIVYTVVQENTFPSTAQLQAALNAQLVNFRQTLRLPLAKPVIEGHIKVVKETTSVSFVDQENTLQVLEIIIHQIVPVACLEHTV